MKNMCVIGLMQKAFKMGLKNMDLYDLMSHHYILSTLECSSVFDDDGSVDFKEFIKQFEHFQINSGVLNNYYSYLIIRDGIKRYANEGFWEEMCYH